MASFHGTVRLESDPDTSVRALVDVGATGLTLLAGDEELGAWKRKDISVHALGTSFILVAGKEKLILELEERSAFGAAVGLDPSPATLRARKAAPSHGKTEPAPTGLKGLFRRARVEPAPVEPEKITPTPVVPPAPAATPAPIAEPASTDAPATPVGAAPPPETERPAAPLEPPPPPSAPRAAAPTAAPSIADDGVPAPAPPEPVVEERAAPAGDAGIDEMAASSATGISAEFQSLRQASAANYTEDEVLKRPIGLALGGAGLVLLIGSVLTWGAARLTSGSFDLGRVLAGIGAIFAITGAYLAMFNEQRRVGAWGAIGGGAVALVILELSAREARIGYGFMLAVIGTVAVLTLGVISLLGWAAAPPLRRPEED